MAQRTLFQNDAQLWRAFQQGDVGAFKHIYQTHSGALFAYGRRLCANEDEVKDIVQDIFVDLWTHRSTLRDLHTIKYYLFKIMRNRLAKQHQRAVVLGYEYLADDEHLLTPSMEVLITQYETSNQQAIQLQKAITELPSRQREAIQLAFYHNFSNEEIAGIMGIHHQSVINHLNRALTTLRNWLDQHPILISFFAALISELEF